MEQTSTSDHDLLVTLVAKVDAFIAGQVASQSDHEQRIRALESGASTSKGMSVASKSLLVAAFSILTILEPLLIWYLSRQ